LRATGRVEAMTPRAQEAPMTTDRPDPVDYLSGRWDGAEVPTGVRPPWPKFAPDGTMLPFPGNTVVAHVPPGSETHAALRDLQDALRDEPFAGRYAVLPPASLHMTVFEGVTETARGTDRWPEGVPADAPRDAVTEALRRRLSGVTLPPLRPRPTGLFAGFSVTLEDDDGGMRAARDRIRDATGIRPADHDGYVFHVTLAYLLAHVPEEEARRIAQRSEALFAGFAPRVPLVELGPPELCDFEDMGAFHPRLTLSR
jgi:hypothetical protein